MNTKFHPNWLRLTAVLSLLFAALASVSPAYADSCLVTTDADSGAGSLREKIANPSCDTITFDGDYTIVLASHLTVDRNVTIDGVGHSVTVSGNHAVRVFVVNSGVTFNINNLTVANGYANTVIGTLDIDGAGIYNQGTLNVTDGIFSDNRATQSWGHGGAIFNDAGTVTLIDTTLSNNWAMFGGGLFNWEGALSVTNSTISGNGSTGILNYGTAVFVNSTFSGNVEGGFANFGTATLTNSTVSGNYVSGIVTNTGTTTLMNTIVADSIVQESNYGNCINFYGGALTGSNNLADDETCGAGFTNSPSILLGPLADNGGPTQTMALLPGSAAIDAGDDAICPTTDQRGVARPYGAHCDIGAYEAEITASDTTPPTITLTTPPESAVYLLGQTVNADYACQDEDGGSGLDSCVGNVPNGSPIDTGAIGAKAFTVNAADNAGNTASVTHSYQVIYNFIGFLSPVDNPPIMNSAKAGQTIPLKWRITDANGNPVTDLTGVSVTAVSLSCPSVPATDAIEEYATSNSGLQNLGDGYYQWNWRSPTSYANSCKTLKLDLGEGAGFEHLALFQFRK